jgi:hypothetical protein
MTEQKKVDRIYVDKKDISSYDLLRQKPSPFANGQNKDIFLAALVVGYHEGVKLPLKSKEGYFRTEYLKSEEKALIKSIAVATTGDLNVLLDEQRIYSIAEEYATGGISLLLDRVQNDSYGSYAKKLENELLQIFGKVTENPPSKTETVEVIETISIEDLIKTGETDQIEFKSSLSWDNRTQKPNKDLKLIIAKTVSSFMNSNGGVLLIGVDDDGGILGLENDFKLYKNRDEFERTLTNLINTHLGMPNITYLKIRFFIIENKEIAAIYVRKSPHVVYVTCDGKETFFIRSGNACQQLQLSEANLYIREHW